MAATNALPGSSRRWEIDDVRVERELALAPLGFRDSSLAPIASDIGRGFECGNVHLSGKIECVIRYGSPSEARGDGMFIT